MLFELLLLLGLIGLFLSNRGLAARVVALEEQLGEPRSNSVTLVRSGEPVLMENPPQPDLAVEDTEEVAAPVRDTLAGLFEKFVGGRLLIWVGGIALAVAGIFLIRYSIEIGLVTPALRMIGAAIFGLLLLGAGEYARRGRFLADDPRIAQALVGAGLAVLYATAYGSYLLYGLIGAGTASALMLAITFAALILSLRHGAPTAMMGLVGGFLTPFLVGDPDAGVVPLLLYLSLLNAAIFAIAWRRGWTWLAACAVAASFAWTGWLIFGKADDALAAGLFIVGLASLSSVLRPGEGRQLYWIQPAAIGLIQLAVLVGRLDLGAPAWALFGTLSAASLMLAALRAEYRLVPPLAVGLALLLLTAKATTGQDMLVPWVGAAITLLFGGFALVLAGRKDRLLWTAMGCAALAGPVLILRAARPELLGQGAWGMLMLALAAAAASLAWTHRAKASEEGPADLSLFLASATGALLAGAAAFDLLSGDTIASAWLVLAIGLAVAARRLRDVGLVALVGGVAALAVARSLWMLPELSVAGVSALVGLPVLAPDLPAASAASWALLLPAVLLAALWRMLPDIGIGFRRALPVVAGLFAVAAAYLYFKHLFGLGDRADFVARGFAERILITQALFALGWLFGSGRVTLRWLEPGQLRRAGTALTVLATARLIWFDMAMHNPLWQDQWVGTMPLLNLLLPAFLLSAVWLYAARRREERATRSRFWLAAFLAALIGGIALLVRQLFQGAILTGPEMPLTEFYVYSLAGLLLSLALLLAGIRLPDKALRLAGLILLTGTILKVFLIDASELEGLLRILSFLGLGIALIGMGKLYGTVLKAESGKP